MNIEIFEYDKKNSDLLKRFALCVAENEDIKNDINIIFVNVEYIREINKKFRDKDVPTDIITFIYNENGVAGEMYICEEIAEQNAIENNRTKEEEVLFLIAHGILHIKGYTHETDEKYAFMMDRQEEHLKRCI